MSMKKLAGVLFAVVVCFVAARTVAAEGPAKGDKIRVLLTVGGHGYEEAPFYALWDALPGVKWTKAVLPKDAGLLKPGLEEQYDVIAMYDMCPGFTPEQQKAFVALLDKGIGVVALHHNLGGHQKWDTFRNIIGGKFCTAKCTIDGKDFQVSTWDHGQDMKITVADNQHPITKGLKDFVIHDETYGGYWVSPAAKILLTTDNPKNKPGQIAWVTKFGNSRVFYLMLGHDHLAWQNPNYSKILLQGLHWAAGK